MIKMTMTTTTTTTTTMMMMMMMMNRGCNRPRNEAGDQTRAPFAFVSADTLLPSQLL